MDSFQTQALNLTPSTNNISDQIQANGPAIYYAAVGIMLLCAWLFHSPKQASSVSAPFYDISRIKWMFDADNLVKNSYTKVSIPHCLARWTELMVDPQSFEIEYTK
jgi:hypothetical protein